MSIRLRVLVVVGVAALATVTYAQPLVQRCNWSVTTPAQPPIASVNVISSPVVVNLGSSGSAHIAFVTYATASDLSTNSGGVLRVIDSNCNEIAQFPRRRGLRNFTLAVVSGVAAGDLDNDGTAELVAVIGSGTGQNRQLAAFNLVGGSLVPRWKSANAPIPFGAAVPAIAQLDGLGRGSSDVEVIIDNNIFNADGTLRWSGSSVPAVQCGGAPCPRSRTTIVANVSGAPRPQLITGRGIYASTVGPMWTFQGPATIAGPISNTELVYPAVAELDASSVGPEIVVTDTMNSSTKGTLYVLSASGALITSIQIANTRCGGPPMIADFDGNGTADIGVATCTAYTAYRYNAGVLSQMWSTLIADPSGQTTSTFYLMKNGGRRIVYNDATNLYVFDASNGSVLQQIPNSSATAHEGPVVVSFETGNVTDRCLMGTGSIIVGANGSQQGIRIFSNSDVGLVASCWNQPTFHVTNLTNSFGAIPANEGASWLATSPARNTYRVQAWP